MWSWCVCFLSSIFFDLISSSLAQIVVIFRGKIVVIFGWACGSWLLGATAQVRTSRDDQIVCSNRGRAVNGLRGLVTAGSRTGRLCRIFTR